MSSLMNDIEIFAQSEFQKELCELSAAELNFCTARAVLLRRGGAWRESMKKHSQCRRAFYFSAEFLMGRAVLNNLICTGIYDEFKSEAEKRGINVNKLEEVKDDALGNGGLGRLAACYMDSAATLNLPLDGYGIRYKYGLFRQKFENGFQKEEADDWCAEGDAWSVRRDEDSVTVDLGDFSVRAVPYDMPIFGFGTEHASTVRLWQSEPLTAFDFNLFNRQKYDLAVKEKNRAEDISRVLYPNDDTVPGKLLRLRQQYFFCSASVADIIRSFKANNPEKPLTELASLTAIQLNDTHPVIAVPELIRRMINEGISFDDAFETARKIFNYTNHTIMQEALEKWDVRLIRRVCPAVLEIIKKIDSRLKKELGSDISPEKARGLHIIQGRTVHMAHLAVYCGSHVNGVAEIHSEIIKKDVLSQWYDLYPERFLNVTNGITQRRWLALCNPRLSSLITELLGGDQWKTDLSALSSLKKYADDEAVLERFMKIKHENKVSLAEYILKKDGISVDPETVFDVQIKRLHEYKRQLLNILVILELYFEIKNGEIKNFVPTTFIFGAKAAPGYFRAKAVIKLINEVSALIAADKDVSPFIKVVFVSDYNVSYAEKIVAAADVSRQISTAGTEASGTGNMKLMLSGAVTLGTYDGANIEIVQQAGEENNYIFGARVEEIERIKASYDPMELYESDEKIKRVMDALIDGTLDDGGTGMFCELYDAILKGASWHKPDHYFVLHDFRACLEASLKVNADYAERPAFAKKCWLNTASAGKFSSDRSVSEYASNIWGIEPVK